MRKIIDWVKDNPNRSMFLLPIILVAGISISHVVSWYDIANPFSWAIYLSIAIEVGAMTALVAATNKIKGGVWFMFGLITLIQMIGNIFYSYKEIDQNGELFKSWVELTGPIWEMIGSDTTDIPSMKRWLAFLEGGLLPIISLTSLHFFVKYEKPKNVEPIKTETEVKNDENDGDDERINQLSDVLENTSPPIEDYNSRLKRDVQRVWENIKKLKEEGKLNQSGEDDLEDEPTELANSEYRLEEDYFDDEEQPSMEEENPEDEIILDTENNKEEPQVEPQTPKTLGEDLQKTWRKIIKKSNNNIGKID